jgi:integrase
MTKVKLRQKPISGNRQTLYLDFYPPIPNQLTGKDTRREFLGLLLFNEIEHEEQAYLDKNGKSQIRIVPIQDKKLQPRKAKLTPIQKQHNKETTSLAENIKAQRQIQIQNREFGFLSDKERDIPFVAYFEKLANERKGSNFDNWTSALKHLKEFTGDSLKITDLNVKVCDDFKKHLLSRPSLTQNSALSYFNKFKAVLKQAHKDRLLGTDLNSSVGNIDHEDTHRNYLTFEELQSAINTKCKLPEMKQAAIFSALTGCRFSDIQKLIWSEVQYSKAEGHYLQFTQKKTKGAEKLPISQQAFDLMGKRRDPDDRVFPNLNYSAYNNGLLREWIKDAGITKHMSFHCFRHTHATLHLTLGTDLYTVSKMLGHREIKTTQVYAKIIDQTKRDAADRMVLDFSGYKNYK